jgi:hypothetical protein
VSKNYRAVTFARDVDVISLRKIHIPPGGGSRITRYPKSTYQHGYAVIAGKS